MTSALVVPNGEGNGDGDGVGDCNGDGKSDGDGVQRGAWSMQGGDPVVT